MLFKKPPRLAVLSDVVGSALLTEASFRFTFSVSESESEEDSDEEHNLTLMFSH